MTEQEEKTCENCRYHKHSGDIIICFNPKSRYSLYVRKEDDSCMEYVPLIQNKLQETKDEKIKKRQLWSEEDEKMLVDCYNAIHRSDYNKQYKVKLFEWLKSIKKKMGG